MFDEIERIYIESSSPLRKYRYLYLVVAVVTVLLLIILNKLGNQKGFWISNLIFFIEPLVARIIGYYMIVKPNSCKQKIFIDGNYTHKIYERVKNNIKEKLDKNEMYNIETIKVLEKYYTKGQKKEKLELNKVIAMAVGLETFFSNPNIYEQIQILIFVLPVIVFFITKYWLDFCLDDVINNKINGTRLNKIFNEFLIELVNEKKKKMPPL